MLITERNAFPARNQTPRSWTHILPTR